MTLRHVLPLSLVALHAACVPATAEIAPRGAAGAIIEPSPASRGEPFVTPDGWTIRVEQLAVAALMSARPTVPLEYYTNSSVLAWDGATTLRSYIPALPVGAYRVAIDINSLYIGPAVVGLESDVAGRFARTADDVETSFDNPSSPREPAVVLVARAKRGSEVIVLDLALQGLPEIVDRDPDVLTPGEQIVDVRANDVSFATLRLAVERLFQTPDGAVAPFQAIADADRAGDRDGRVTGRELRSRPSDPAGCPEKTEGEGSGEADAGPSEPVPVEDDPCASPLARFAVRVERIIEREERGSQARP